MNSTKWPPHGDKKKLKGEDVSQLSLVQHYLPYFLEVLTEKGLAVCVCVCWGGGGEGEKVQVVWEVEVGCVVQGWR